VGSSVIVEIGPKIEASREAEADKKSVPVEADKKSVEADKKSVEAEKKSVEAEKKSVEDIAMPVEVISFAEHASKEVPPAFGRPAKAETATVHDEEETQKQP
jgi:hypothetical protein